MTDRILHASLDWHPGDVPVSRTFGDVYFSAEDGLAETEHVFLNGNRLAERFAQARAFHIGELGFGTGLGFVAAWRLWRASTEGTLAFTSFEWAPLSRAEMARALARFPELAPEVTLMLQHWPPDGVEGPLELPGAVVDVRVGDARVTLPRWEGQADAWFLDGFAPSRNPELWGEGLIREVAARTAPGGTVATYSAAGTVRRALARAGFDVVRTEGFGRKRHMVRGTRIS